MSNTLKQNKDKNNSKYISSNNLNKKCCKNQLNSRDYNKWQDRREELKNSNIKEKYKDFGISNCNSIDKLNRSKDKSKNKKD